MIINGRSRERQGPKYNMDYTIVADSSCDVTQEMVDKFNIVLAPLSLELNGKQYIDDGSMDIKSFLEEANQSKDIPKTACPAPETYLNAFKAGKQEIFCITLSSALSGSYASAMLAKQLYEEENSDKKIHVFDSRSASSGQVLLILKIIECREKEMNFEDTVKFIESYISKMQTIFVLDKLDHLGKSGRLTYIQEKIASILNLKLVLAANRKGEVEMLAKARGLKKAYGKMIDAIGEIGENLTEKSMIISHCLNEKAANMLREKLLKKYNFKEIIIVPTGGLSSNYANMNSIILAF